MKNANPVWMLSLLLLAATGRLQPLAVLAVAAVAGMVRPSDIGMRTALVGATVPPQHLMAAMGISRTSMDSAKAAGALVGAVRNYRELEARPLVSPEVKTPIARVALPMRRRPR